MDINLHNQSIQNPDLTGLKEGEMIYMSRGVNSKTISDLLNHIDLRNGLNPCQKLEINDLICFFAVSTWKNAEGKSRDACLVVANKRWKLAMGNTK